MAPPRGSFFLFGVRGIGKSTWVRGAFPDAYVIDLLDERRYHELVVSTVRGYIEAMGGELEIIARFPEGSVKMPISAFDLGVSLPPGRR